jgi:hypothetical protein
MEWIYAAFVALLAVPVVLSAFAFLLLLWNKPFVILAGVWAGATVTMLIFAPTAGAKFTAVAVGAVLLAAWLTSGWWRRPVLLLRRAVQQHASHRHAHH